MSSFVDHLQILPVPSVGGVRQPDGDHRPGGLGMLTLADRLVARGWTARVEDIGFDKRLPERRIAESYARAIGDGVLSAWERDRFPIVLSRVSHGALGVVDALGDRTGVLWVSPRAEYRRPGLLRRSAFDRTTVAMITGRGERDSLAVSPVRLEARRVVLLGGWKSGDDELRALAEDGGRVLAREEVDGLGEAVGDVDTRRWYLHLDVNALHGASVPAADEPAPEGFEPNALSAAIEGALAGRTIGCVGLARYDLNRDRSGRTAETLVELLEHVAKVAGGQPRPEEAAGSAAGT
ncbi:MAG: arginase family protein [Gemmatimonadetes bacterium]|nr:arginase family protein [Gemmatimonadota bacterium]